MNDDMNPSTIERNRVPCVIVDISIDRILEHVCRRDTARDCARGYALSTSGIVSDGYSRRIMLGSRIVNGNTCCYYKKVDAVCNLKSRFRMNG